MEKYVKWLFFFFVILLCHITKSNNLFLLTISFSLLMIFYNLFSCNNFKNILSNYHDKKYYHSRDKLFKYFVSFVFVIMLFLGLFSYLLGNIMGIYKLGVVNITSIIFLFFLIVTRITGEYLEVIGHKKIGSNLFSVFLFVTIIVDLVGAILTFNIFKLDDYFGVMSLYLGSVLTFILLFTILYFKIFRKMKRNTYRDNRELKINYFKEIKNIFIKDTTIVVFNIIKPFYIYFSIVILYYLLINKYGYNYDEVGQIITDTYFFGIIVFYFIYLVMRSFYINNIEDLINEIKNKNKKINVMFNNLINKVVDLSLMICIVLSVISGPINLLLFDNNYNVVLILVPFLLFYILYNVVVRINLVCNKSKTVLIIILLGACVKMIFEVGFIATVYRMGYSLIFGSIISSVLGFTISIIIGLFFTQRRLKISYLENFTNILNIIYDNLLFCAILVLFTLVVKVNTDTILSSILVILFYLMVSTLLIFIKKRLKKK